MRRILAALVLCSGGLACAASPDGPDDSLYRMSTALIDQSGTPMPLEHYRGYPVVISMFYGSCPHVCPLLISSIRQFESRLPDPQRQNLRVLLISLDPDRDTPAKLTEIAEMHHVDVSRWSLARTDKRSVRRLAAALDIQYRRLPSGEINHSTVITLLDAEGRIVRQTSSLLRPDAEFSMTLAKATR